eukprot:TRINITY_DN18202_c0_g1_i2.p1 TRINITY_DN18202_c0_g1~~TRINITY_DN18202_c0_g1_i2.p1  ORF type:complete len:194 (+),score=61.30 TRINITY_DN18202_c0_g1_i2:230-811(+)
MAQSSDVQLLTQQLIAAFNTCDDTQFVTTANQGLADVEAAAQQRETKFQDLIREMTAKVDDARGKAAENSDVVDRAVYDARVKEQKELDAQMTKALADKTNAERHLKELNSSLATVKADVSKEKKARNKADKALPQAIDLFKEVTGISWDYLAADIRGTHQRAGGASIKTPFAISATTETERVNKLWDMIGSS